MMKPTASVLLPKPLTNLDRVSLELLPQWQGLFTNPWHYHLNLWFNGLGSVVDTDDLPQLAENFGFWPADELHIDAISGSIESLLWFGQCCILLAERFDGIVNYNANLWPDFPGDEKFDVMNCDWREIEPFVSPILASMPGKVIATTYEPTEGRQWATHYGDATFARAWFDRSWSHIIN